MTPMLTPARHTGAALMLVLWLLLLVSGLIAVFALSARTEGIQASALRQSVQARFAAEAGIEIAVVHLLASDPTQRWAADGRVYRFSLEGQPVGVAIQDESGKFDLNLVSIEHLSRLMQGFGIDPLRAGSLAGAIVDWRDPDDLLSVAGAEDGEYETAGLPYGAKDQPFTSVSELQQVLGMDYALYRQLAPQLTVYTGEARPNLFAASPAVLQALALPPDLVAQVLALRAAWQPGMPAPTLPDGQTLAGDGTGTYSISSRAQRPGGAALEVNAIVRAGGGGLFGQLYAPLAWRVGDPD